MPKLLVKNNENLRRVHPFRLAYHYHTRNVEIMRVRICQKNKWSQPTFYRKLSGDEKLTELEAQNVSAVLGIKEFAIKEFQQGFKTDKKTTPNEQN